MNRVFFTDRDLGRGFPAILAAAGLHVEARPMIAKVYRAHPSELARNPRAPGRVGRWYQPPRVEAH